MSIFKAYDIRGIYGTDLTDELAYKIGKAFATFLKPRTVVVGRDMRPHSTPLFAQLSRGLTELGCDVVDIGVVSTPISYFANGTLGADASIMITASHNPGEWNGFKLCREKAIPISGATGIKDLECIVREGAYAPKAATPGRISTRSFTSDYVKRIRSFADFKRPLRIAVDYANGMGIVEGEVLRGLPGLSIDPIFDTLDGTFPNHEANPLLEETWHDLSKKVKAGSYDLAIAFDGDADRCGFMDEKGAIIPMDMITALVAEMLLKQQPGSSIYYDLRSSWSVKEVIEENGGKPLMSRVGHAFIKQQMREADAVFAGELSGHYYFKENFYTESSSLVAIQVANLISRSSRPLSELIRPIQRYCASGEINSHVADVPRVLAALKQRYGASARKSFELDGHSFEFEDWWFNVRSSNTEPLCRLNLEAKTRPLMESKRDEVLAVIRG